MFTAPFSPGIITPESLLSYVEEGFRDLERVLKSLGRREFYLPVWASNGTQPALGNGTLLGEYVELGAYIIVNVDLTMGSTTTFGTGKWSFSLPRIPVVTGQQMVGPAFFFDSGTAVYNGNVTGSGGVNTVAPVGYNNVSTVGPTIPFTWTQNDRLVFTFGYATA